jgi:hypothetical protein
LNRIAKPSASKTENKGLENNFMGSVGQARSNFNYN